MSDKISAIRREGIQIDEQKGEAEHSKIAPRRTDPATVLLADDDDAFRETLRIWLSDSAEWNTREASDGEEALDNLDDSIDLLVLDRGMPKVSGPEVVEQLVETPFRGATIILSADRPDADLNEDDVEMYLLKPINRESFLDHLEHCRQ